MNNLNIVLRKITYKAPRHMRGGFIKWTEVYRRAEISSDDRHNGSHYFDTWIVTLLNSLFNFTNNVTVFKSNNNVNCYKRIEYFSAVVASWRRSRAQSAIWKQFFSRFFFISREDLYLILLLGGPDTVTLIYSKFSAIQ